MASAGPDLWSSGLPPTDPDTRGALLRLQAVMFVSAPSRDRETIRSFEAMTLGFISRVDEATLAEVARLVAPCPDTPADVLVALAQGSCETRGIVAAAAPRLPADAIQLLLGTARGRHDLAARRDLDEHALEALLVVNEEAVDAVLAANPAVSPGRPAFEVLLGRARERAPVARALLARDDLTLSDEAALYLQADPDRRAEIRHRIAASALFQRTSVPRVRGAEIEVLLGLAQAGDVPGFEHALSSALEVSGEASWRLVEANRSELLALAMTALALDEDDAVRIFLTLHPAIAHSVATVFDLVRIIRQVSRPTALAVIGAVLGVAIGSERQGRHVPGLDASGTPARGAGLSTAEHGRPSIERRQKAG